MLGVPGSRLDQLSQRSSDSVSSKQMMLREWITSHPAPSWDIVTETLYQGGLEHAGWHSILMEVKKLYGKGESSHTGNPLVSKLVYHDQEVMSPMKSGHPITHVHCNVRL